MKPISEFSQEIQEIVSLFDNKNYKEAKDLYAECLSRVYDK